jgi:hypothetical protein
LPAASACSGTNTVKPKISAHQYRIIAIASSMLAKTNVGIRGLSAYYGDSIRFDLILSPQTYNMIAVGCGDVGEMKH